MDLNTIVGIMKNAEVNVVGHGKTVSILLSADRNHFSDALRREVESYAKSMAEKTTEVGVVFWQSGDMDCVQFNMIMKDGETSELDAEVEFGVIYHRQSFERQTPKPYNAEGSQ